MRVKAQIDSIKNIIKTIGGFAPPIAPPEKPFSDLYQSPKELFR
jgi:hypothetical protein